MLVGICWCGSAISGRERRGIKEADKDAALAAYPAARRAMNGNHFQMGMLAYNFEFLTSSCQAHPRTVIRLRDRTTWPSVGLPNMVAGRNWLKYINRSRR